MSAAGTERGRGTRGSGAAAGAAANEPGGSGIRFDGVGVAYGGTTVLDSLDLRVEPGEVMALLGPVRHTHVAAPR